MTKVTKFHLKNNDVKEHRKYLMTLLEKLNPIMVHNTSLEMLEAMPQTNNVLNGIESLTAKAVAATIEFNNALNDYFDHCYSNTAVEVIQGDYQQLLLQEVQRG